ncbi:hypothetical protein [Kitasatospora sp. NPDC051914]|uniref:hypothetical protein n=1 Tax=Kitasatospora sp. NPDC051914 TaxID=3154945 RepID=UPI00342D6EA2
MTPCSPASCSCTPRDLAVQARAWSRPRHRRPVPPGTGQVFDSFLSWWGRARRADLR